jgi:dipeptidyl aminopeptidase/acylaminoacyl peptidase
MEAFYNKLNKTEAQLIFYPQELHRIKETSPLVDRLKRIVSWFDKHLKNSP